MYGGWLKHASFVGHELFNFFRTYDSRVCCDGIIPVSRVVLMRETGSSDANGGGGGCGCISRRNA